MAPRSFLASGLNKNKASALLVVMTVMAGLTLLLISWWQAVGWAGDLVLVRQRYISRFYATEIVLNYGVAWTKKEFDSVTKSLVAKPKVAKSGTPIILDGGTVNLGSGGVGKCILTIDRVPGDRDDHSNVVRVAATMVVDNKIVACHRCLLEHDLKEQRFVVSHFSFGLSH